MGTQALDVAGTKARLEAASRFALTQFKSLGLSTSPKAPDLKKLEAAMGPKTPPVAVNFDLSFDGKTISYYVEVGGAKTVLASVALASTGKPGVQRAIIEKMIKLGGIAATKADLDKFNKDHPPPPTPEQQGKLNQALAPLRMQLRDAIADVKKAQAALDAAQAAVKAAETKIKPFLEVEKEYQKRWDAD
jgi:hypothetical protein